MTINLADNTPRVSYAVAAGVTQSSFTVSFEFFDDADLNVYVDGTQKTLTTDYTVTGGDGSTGSVSISVTGAAGGSTVVITRDIDLKRTTDFPASGAFQVGSLNTELDKLIAIAADLDDKASRSLQLTDYDTAVSLVLPDVDTRKGKTLAFNASTGAVESGPSISDVQTVSAASADIATLADIEDGTDATDAIQTVAGIASNVTTVAGVSANVTTVAGIASNVTAVANDATDIGTVAGLATEIGRLGTADAVADMAILATADVVSDLNTLATSAIVTDMDALANLTSELDALADITSNITTVAGISSNVTTVAGVASNVTTVAGVSGNVTTVAGVASDVTTVAGVASDVTTVAGQISPTNNVGTVAGISSDVSTVAGISANTTTVAGISANVTTVAGVSSDVTTVAGISSNVTTVAGISSDVTTVAGVSSNVTTVATNITDVNNFADRYTISASEPSGASEGDLWFDSTNDIMKVYDGSGFVNAGSSVNGTSERNTYTATSGQTTFSATYDSGFVDVYLNGVKLIAGTDFTATNGTSIVLASGAALNDTVDIVAYGTFELLNTSINSLTDVNTSGVTNGQVLAFNSTSSDFEPTTIESFPSGTLMLFQQTSAPTGWTKQTTHNDKALRIVTGTVGSGGSSAFSTALATPSVTGTVTTSVANTTAGGSIANTTAGGTVANHTLTVAQLASHNHSVYYHAGYQGGSVQGAGGGDGGTTVYGGITSSTGSNSAHSHSFTGTAHNHTFTGTAHNHTATSTLSSSTAGINVEYVDAIIASKD